MPKFELLGGGVGWGDSPEVKTQNLLSAKCQDLPKIQLNFLLGGGILPSQNSKSSKCEDLPKFEFSRGEGVIF